jgi:hypothetical protein
MSDPEGRRRSWRRAALAAAGVGLVLIAGIIASSRLSTHRPRSSGTASSPTPSTTPSTSPTTTPAQPVPAGEQFGASVNWLFNGRNYTSEQIDAQLEALRRTGATVARSDALWELTEPAPPVAGQHHYDWRFDDSIAGSLAAHGLFWLPILDYSAPWARASPGLLHSPPSSPADYAAYAAAFVARYGPGGAFWSSNPDVPAAPVQTLEIWNEPDNPGFWMPTPDSRRYADLYLAAREAITAVDPEAHVIVGGLTHPRGFLPAMLTASPELRGRLDGVALHPYGANPFIVLSRVRTARRVLRSLRLATVALYVTEFGWTTSPPGGHDYLPERLRPDYIARTLAALGHTDCGVSGALLYTWLTPERSATNPEDWFGISPPGGGGSADTTAFADGLAMARAPGATLGLCGAT